jgi:hypothetical protein
MVPICARADGAGAIAAATKRAAKPAEEMVRSISRCFN